jgi:hypothetical protein
MRRVRTTAGSDLSLRSFGFANDAKPQEDLRRKAAGLRGLRPALQGKAKSRSLGFARDDRRWWGRFPAGLGSAV